MKRYVISLQCRNLTAVPDTNQWSSQNNTERGEKTIELMQALDVIFHFSASPCSTLLQRVNQGLVVQLGIDRPVSEFRSIEDVKNCNISATDFCLPKGGATEASWKIAVEAARKDCRKPPLEQDQPTFVTAGEQFKDPYSAGLAAVANRKCKYFLALASTVTVATETIYCNKLSVVGKPFFPSPVSIVLPKDSNITGPISTATLKLQQRDKLESPIAYGVREKCVSVLSANRLNWRRLGVLFYVTWVLHVAMFAYMLLDKRGPKSKHDVSRILPQ